MTNSDPRDIGLAFLEAWGASDMATARTHLHPDITFRSPQAELEGIDAVAEAMGQFAQLVTSIDIIAAAAHDDEVLVMYDMHTGPFGTVRASEHYTLQDGLIVSDHLVFDTAPMQQ